MKLFISIFFLLFAKNIMAQKIFHQKNAKGEWQYIYPFKDKTYVLAIQSGTEQIEDSGGLENMTLYFGKSGAENDVIFWKETIAMRSAKDNTRHEDFNNDGIKDLMIFSETGGRGGNEFYNLFLVNPKNHTLIKIKGFNTIVNPSYHKKYGVILGYGLAGSNYYSVHKIDRENKVYQIEESFEDNNDLDLEAKIKLILYKKYKK